MLHKNILNRPFSSAQYCCLHALKKQQQQLLARPPPAWADKPIAYQTVKGNGEYTLYSWVFLRGLNFVFGENENL